MLSETGLSQKPDNSSKKKWWQRCFPVNPNPRIPTLKLRKLPPSPQPLLLTPLPYRLQITGLLENNFLQWSPYVWWFEEKGSLNFLMVLSRSRRLRIPIIKIGKFKTPWWWHGLFTPWTKVLEIVIFFIPQHRKFGMPWPWHTLISKIHLKYTNFVIG